MKPIIPISLFLLILCIALPALIMQPAAVSDVSEETPEVSDGKTEADGEAETDVETEAGGETGGSREAVTFTGTAGEMDNGLTVKVLVDGAVREMSMYDYLTGVVAAEMPITFEPEALKAQAVAARTYTLYKMLVSASGSHPEADVCDDYTCCKAYKTPEELTAQWGEAYDNNAAVIAAAVAETDGVCLVHEDEPILAAFHSSSSGHTEASADIWGDVPYLQSVQTFETEDNVPDFYSAVTISYDEFKETVLAVYGEANFDGAYEAWITDIVRSDTGRITAVTIGGVAMTGAEFRNLFSLRSTNIEVERIDEGFVLSAEGYGHGVGLSQHGANLLARVGLDYQAILYWYYTGVTAATMDTLF